jgi:signal transduction histidine kinase
VRGYSKVWTAAVAVCTAALVMAALVFPRSFQLTAFSDWVQCVLLLSGALAFIPNALHSEGRQRIFWTFMSVGMVLWFAYQVMWTYYEVWLHADVPDLFAADIVLFLHIVPLMAAVALRPHVRHNEYAARLRRLDFALMMVWWMYLYVFSVMAWQYVVPNIPAYDSNLNFLYLIEKLAFLGGLLAAWLKSKDGWRIFYANLFGASLTYAGSSYVANWAISRHVYYSGSLYDIPLAASMAWVTWIGLHSRKSESQTSARPNSTSHGVWLARAGMIAVFSLPLFAAWALLEPAVPVRIRSFRLILTLGAALFMGIMVFVRQRRLDHELVRLLGQSHESLVNLKRLQHQITESEKLASMGQLVGGAAHELNNPITAMMGYSDLLLTTPLNSEQQDLAAQIGHHVRRTRSLVASLLSFAKQGPSFMVQVDLRTVLRTAVKLTESNWQGLKIEIRIDLQIDLPPVMGDSNQLLQVCVQVLDQAVNAAKEHKIGCLTLAAKHRNGVIIISIFSRRVEDIALEVQQAHPAAPSQSMSALGLSACQGILQQHRGTISWKCNNGDDEGISIRMELPIIPPAMEKSNAAAPRAWQVQPFA